MENCLEFAQKTRSEKKLRKFPDYQKLKNGKLFKISNEDLKYFATDLCNLDFKEEAIFWLQIALSRNLNGEERRFNLMVMAFCHFDLNDYENALRYGFEAYKMKDHGKCCFQENEQTMVKVLSKSLYATKQYDKAIEFSKLKLKMTQGKSLFDTLQDYSDLIQAFIGNKSWEKALKVLNKIKKFNICCTYPDDLGMLPWPAPFMLLFYFLDCPKIYL